MRVTAVLTHPIQYYSPWFREIESSCPEIDLKVIYVMIPTPAQQGVGFGKEFAWDVSLLEGYDYVTVRSALPGDSIHSERFRGMDAPGIGRIIESTSPDAVLIPGWYSISLVRALFACRRMKIPVMYRGDTQLSGRTFVKALLSRARTRTMLPMYSAFLSPGTRNEEYLEANGVSKRRIFSAPHAVDNELFAKGAAAVRDPVVRGNARRELGIGDRDFCLLFVGKLETKKRPWQLIEAAHAAGGDAVVVIAGTGEAESRCREVAAKTGVRTIFRGFVNQSGLGAVYGLADCLVLPSDHRETWGLVVNEAMASGLPCIVSEAVGCAPDLIIPEKTGVTFPLDDVVSLSRAIGFIRQSSRAGYDFGSHCRAHIANFTFQAATRGLLEAASFVTNQRQDMLHK